MRKLVPPLFPCEGPSNDVVDFGFVFNNSEKQRRLPIKVNQLANCAGTSALCQSFFHDLVFVFALLGFEFLSEVYLILGLKHEVLVTTDYLVFEFVEVLANHRKVIGNCVVVCLVVSVCLLKRVCVKLNFLLHLHSMCAFHQVDKRCVYVSVFAHRETQVKRFRVRLVAHKYVEERTIQVAVVQVVVWQQGFRNLGFFLHLLIQNIDTCRSTCSLLDRSLT